MLTEKEKLGKRNDFVSSEDFGIDTLSTLFIFRQNAIDMLNTIGFMGDFIQKMDDKEIFPSSLGESQIIHIKQHLTLDVISKLLMIIEGLFVLTHSLNDGYSYVSKNMLNYPPPSPWDVIKNIKSNSYSWMSILSLLTPEKFDLSSEEKSDLQTVYDHTINVVKSSFLKLISFYEQFNIVYNKSKHGLSLEPGGFMAGEVNRDLFHSSLSALDHRTENKMPPNYQIAKITESSDKTWFNVESRINFNPKLFTEIGNTVNDLEILCNYIVDNHLTHANNCGENYLPILKNKDNQFSVNFITTLPVIHNRDKILENLNRKILPDMVTSDIELSMRRNYTKEPLSTIIKENSITNVFLKSNDESE